MQKNWRGRREIWSFEKGKDAPYRDQSILPCPCRSSTAGESLLVRRPKAWGLNLGRISPTPYHLTTSLLSSQLSLTGTQYFFRYFIVYFCDVFLKIFISRLRCRYQTQSNRHKNTLVGGPWSLVSGDIGVWHISTLDVTPAVIFAVQPRTEPRIIMPSAARRRARQGWNAVALP